MLNCSPITRSTQLCSYAHFIETYSQLLGTSGLITEIDECVLTDSIQNLGSVLVVPGEKNLPQEALWFGVQSRRNTEAVTLVKKQWVEESNHNLSPSFQFTWIGRIEHFTTWGRLTNIEALSLSTSCQYLSSKGLQQQSSLIICVMWPVNGHFHSLHCTGLRLYILFSATALHHPCVSRTYLVR